MAKKHHYQVPKEVEKLRNRALVVFDTLVQEAVNQMNAVGNDIKKRIQEEMKKTDKDTAALDKLCKETQNKVTQYGNDGVKNIQEAWSSVRTQIEAAVAVAQLIVTVQSGYVDQLMNEMDKKIEELQNRTGESVLKHNKDLDKIMHDFKKKVLEENKTRSKRVSSSRK